MPEGSSSLVGPAAAPTHPVRRLRALALGSLVALVALGLAWELWLAPTGRGTLALKVLPLLAAVSGLARHRLYTFRWLSLLVWLYFTEGVVHQFASWTERPVRQLPRLLQRRLEARDSAAAVGIVGERVRADWLLTLGVDTLHHDVSTPPGQARLAF